MINLINHKIKETLALDVKEKVVVFLKKALENSKIIDFKEETIKDFSLIAKTIIL